ncbi:pyridine nucleotide-disulfide oxidoreductase domain-containing protein [Ditylenchus destructor]|uniref:Pyridine nucleotide-disulfide oxidoreductase domain-containing protein n=1 Tax=Ditylenchus destructor TaxID=166010 RepID=A0AAD4RDG0_9BILA|nr:pyridine nucleotide-disulfide oxidoreductase domain-containing protein [Ditylenchus destructor]
MWSRFSTAWRSCSVPYLLIGGGTASYYAALTIRARDPDAKVMIITDENDSPYKRQLLSKEFWWYGDKNTPTTLSYTSPGSEKRRYIRYEADGFYPKWDDFVDKASTDNNNGYLEHGGISLMRNCKAMKLDARKREVELSDGNKINYEKCLIATGSRAKPLKELDTSNSKLEKSITHFRSVEDYKKLESAVRSKDESEIVVIGGGILGSELVYSLTRRFGPAARYPNREDEPKVHITHLFPEAGLLTGVLPPMFSDYATNQMKSHGRIEMNLANARSQETDASKNSMEPVVEKLVCDYVVVATDETEPNVEFVSNSGLKLDNKNGGILADSQMKVMDNIWAAGDVCSFDDPVIGRRRRVQNWEHAQISGRVAGENMTGGNKAFSHQGAFMTVFSSGDHVSAVGDIDSSLETISYVMDPEEDDEEGKARNEESQPVMRAVVFYLVPSGTDEGKKRIVGVLLYNIFEGMELEIARKLITDGKEIEDGQMCSDLARLFDIFPEPDEEDAENNENAAEI